MTGEFEKQVKKLCLDPKAEQELNPYSGEVDSFLKDVSEEFVGDKFPFSTSVTKELWSGKFSL